MSKSYSQTELAKIYGQLYEAEPDYRLWEEEVIRCKIRLDRSQPFFAFILARPKVVPWPNMKAPFAEDGKRIYYNPHLMGQFRTAVVDGQKRHYFDTGIVHEVLHSALRHTARYETFVPKMVNRLMQELGIAYGRAVKIAHSLWARAIDREVFQILYEAGFPKPDFPQEPPEAGVCEAIMERLTDEYIKQEREKQEREKQGAGRGSGAGDEESEEGDGESDDDSDDDEDSDDDQDGDSDQGDADEDSERDQDGEESEGEGPKRRRKKTSGDDSDDDEGSDDNQDGDSDQGDADDDAEGDEESDEGEECEDAGRGGRGNSRSQASAKDTDDDGDEEDQDESGKDQRQDRAAEDEGDEEEAPDWEQVLVEAAMHAKMAGKLPGFLEEKVEATIKRPFDWKAFIARVVRSLLRRKSTYNKLNRRFLSRGMFLPGRIQEGVEVVFGMDTSGSMGSPELAEGLSWLWSLFRGVNGLKLTWLACDAKVAHVCNHPKDVQMKGRGGTSFRPVFEYIKLHRLRPQLLVYFTDGYCFGGWPEDPRTYPVLWAITTDVKPPWGHHVRVKL